MENNTSEHLNENQKSKMIVIISIVIFLIIISIAGIITNKKNISEKNVHQINKIKNYFSEKNIEGVKKAIDDFEFSLNGKSDLAMVFKNYYEKYKVMYNSGQISIDQYEKMLMLSKQYDYIQVDKDIELLSEKKIEVEENLAYKNALDKYSKGKYKESWNELIKIRETSSLFEKTKILKSKIEEKFNQEIIDSIKINMKNGGLALAAKYIDENMNLKDFVYTEEALSLKSEVKTNFKKEQVEKEKLEKEKLEKEEADKKKNKENELEEKNYGKAMNIVHSKYASQNYKVNLIERGKENIKGELYYLFLVELDDMGGDSLDLIRVKDFKHFKYYSNGDLITIEKYDQASIQPIEVSIGELNKSPHKYMFKLIRIEGRVVYIKEQPYKSTLVISNRNNEMVQVKYGFESTVVKGDYVSIIGTGNGTSKELATAGGLIPLELPLVNLKDESIEKR